MKPHKDELEGLSNEKPGHYFNNPLRVVCIDDNDGIRQLLRGIINSDPRLRIVGDFRDVPSAIESLQNLACDVIILDVRLPEKNGIESVPDIRAVAPEARILILTISSANIDLFDALEAGVDGYLLKRSCPSQIIESILSVHRGGFPITPAIAGELLKRFRCVQESKTEYEELLTSRQIEILDNLSKGLSVKEVAGVLGISVLTVRFHMRMMYKRLGVTSQSQALRKHMELSKDHRSLRPSQASH